MKYNFCVASVVAAATATAITSATAVTSTIDYHRDPYNELDVIVDGQA